MLSVLFRRFWIPAVLCVLPFPMAALPQLRIPAFAMFAPFPQYHHRESRDFSLHAAVRVQQGETAFVTAREPSLDGLKRTRYGQHLTGSALFGLRWQPEQGSVFAAAFGMTGTSLSPPGPEPATGSLLQTTAGENGCRWAASWNRQVSGWLETMLSLHSATAPAAGETVCGGLAVDLPCGLQVSAALSRESGPLGASLRLEDVSLGWEHARSAWHLALWRNRQDPAAALQAGLFLQHMPGGRGKGPVLEYGFLRDRTGFAFLAKITWGSADWFWSVWLNPQWRRLPGTLPDGTGDAQQSLLGAGIGTGYGF
jgi:hypothetical protein